MKTDVLIVGAGIIGCALAYELSKYKIDVLVIEKTSYVGAGATKANSAMLHAGLSTKPDTLKAKLVKGAKDRIVSVCRELDVPCKENVGLITLAFHEEERVKLDDLVADAKRLGLHGKLLNREETLAMEPHLNQDLIGSFYSKDVGVVSPYELAIVLAENAVLNGVNFLFNDEILFFNKIENRIKSAVTRNTTITPNIVLNCAGIHADRIARLAGSEDLRLHPRKGEYYVYDNTIKTTISHVVSVLGSSKSKGMVLVPSTHGNIIAGSSAADIEDKDDLTTTGDVLDRIYEEAIHRMCPELKRTGDVISTFSGVRAVSETEDFVIEKSKAVDNLVHVAGIQSPGLTSCLNIADYAIELCKDLVSDMRWQEKEDHRFGRAAGSKIVAGNHCESNTLIEQNKNYGEIVCRCEKITKGEIIDAVHHALPALTTDAIKRKLRVGMGRCQGGFCLQRLIAILAEELNTDLSGVRKDEEGSNYLFSPDEGIAP